MGVADATGPVRPQPPASAAPTYRNTAGRPIMAVPDAPHRWCSLRPDALPASPSKPPERRPRPAADRPSDNRARGTHSPHGRDASFLRQRADLRQRCRGAHRSGPSHTRSTFDESDQPVAAFRGSVWREGGQILAGPQRCQLRRDRRRQFRLDRPAGTVAGRLKAEPGRPAGRSRSDRCGTSWSGPAGSPAPASCAGEGRRRAGSRHTAGPPDSRSTISQPELSPPVLACRRGRAHALASRPGRRGRRRRAARSRQQRQQLTPVWPTKSSRTEGIRRSLPPPTHVRHSPARATQANPAGNSPAPPRSDCVGPETRVPRCIFM